MIGEVVGNCGAGKVLASHALAVEKDVFALKITGHVALSNDSQRHVPVERSARRIAAIGFFDPITVCIICVCESSIASDPVFKILGVVRSLVVMHHVAGGVVAVCTLQLIAHGSGHAQVFRIVPESPHRRRKMKE